MPRLGNRRLKIAFIENDYARKQSFKKRQKGLLKKMVELTTLCEVEACAIINSPYEHQPVAWPSRDRAVQVIEKFINIPSFQRWSRMNNQSSFLSGRILKAREQFKRLRQNNNEIETRMLMFNILKNGGTLPANLMGLENLGQVVNRHLIDVERRLNFLKNGGTAAMIGEVQEGSRNNGPINLPPRENFINRFLQQNVTSMPAQQHLINLLPGKSLISMHPQEYIMNPHSQENVYNTCPQENIVDLASQGNGTNPQRGDSGFSGMISLQFDHNDGGLFPFQHSY